MAYARILIVDDETVLSRSLQIDLQDDGFAVDTADSGEAALALIETSRPDLVLLDLRLPGINGIHVLEKIRTYTENPAVIIMTAYGDTQTTVEAIKCGADDFINKPFELRELKRLIHKALDVQKEKREFEYLKYQQRRFRRFSNLVGESEAMQSVFEKIELLAEADDCNVLILGESGTGKDLVASAIHYKSRRSKSPFVEINCTAFPESLLESELFGYEKGAFTDAKARKVGLLELGEGGSIFLDEIGEMALASQAKLLMFLEKKKFKRLGSGKDLEVDARIIAATNRDLEKAMRDRRFRQDLYYRLNVASLHLPPLRQRKSDIPLLVDYFLKSFCEEMGKEAMTPSAQVMDLFFSYPWYGNVRELRNVIERAVIFSRGHVIEIDHLPHEMRGSAGKTIRDFFKATDQIDSLPIDEVLAEVEKELIENALKASGGNKSSAAENLGISRFSLKRRLDRLKLDR
ncbi:acetoacetate metabolism regulatory protein AtoC [Desulfosarcina ovata subsp. sediminis]|uniref:Acetoacetate metabolism regulatory protein AtoC n=1 Tax=Desulfosarcina ovata subsp. sediminis TaxID=885957 RepID=A0A5K7ZLJ3_9BACT|nr:sigma-54 dependent transcriptional regulator [Desulfosarcina ovata]BBO80529.1 acetoacetate metabolism regulatory protein AtoC [Desulfosarcina ovata subsp. sediminis]